MTRLFLPLAVIAGTSAIPAMIAAPASAQQTSTTETADDGSKIAEIIVYGNDPCPRSTDDAIVVCARKPETERYRIPERYRDAGPRQTRQSWAQKAKSFEYVGRTGIQSCSAVGPGGSSGCLQNMIDRARAESREGNTQAAPPPESSPPGPGY